MTSDNEVREENGHTVRSLHGVTLAEIVAYLVEHVGFPSLADQVKINCFLVDPSVKSSLVFLRRTPWARTKVESLYVEVRSRDLLRSRG
jgi:uncharacterized protein (DUF2132 family)